jgi:molybdate transport system substrate-binding protein
MSTKYLHGAARHARPLLCLCFAAFLLSGCKKDPPPQAPAVVRVAAAADLTLAFEELGREFTKESGTPVSFTFGSTGLLSKQLKEGAPFDLFAAANVSFVDQVVAAGACDGATKAPYARGRIAVWSKRGAVEPPAKLEDLADPRFKKLALANPEHAPYGVAARDALRTVGVWEAVESRLVFGEKVKQTLQFAESGNVEAAIVALALVVNDHDNPWILIDDQKHAPIDQALVVCKRGAQRAGAEEFARFVSSQKGRALMRRFGFLLPGEQLGQAP